MKKLISLFVFLSLVACSDNSEHPQDKKGQFEGFFMSRKTTKTREPGPVAWKSGLMIEKITETLILLRVQEGVYHEYQVVTTNSGTPLLSEKTYEYTQKQNGIFEIILVADTCGDVKTSSLYDLQEFKPMLSERSMQTVDGVIVVKITQAEYDKLATPIEVNKSKDLYKTDCSPTTRKVKNTATDWWNWIF